MKIVERPANTYTPGYKKNREQIIQWRKDNPDWVRNYNREYQRKLRKDPIKRQMINDRASMRGYITLTYNSYKMQMQLGCSVQQIMEEFGLDKEGWKQFIKVHEQDHIIPYTWFTGRNEHLKKFYWRRYNLQFVKRATNRTKSDFIDEENPIVKRIIYKMTLEYLAEDPVSNSNEIHKVSMLLRRLEKQLAIR